MRILVVHNDYGRYSGEEAVVDRMISDFRQAGHTVVSLRRSSEKARNTLLGNIHGFFSGIYSMSGRRMMRKALRDFKPDVVNIHNLYPFISPSVLPLCSKQGFPIVMTVHNYRLICPTGLFLRDGKPCENCLKNGNEIDCLRYNCEHSRLRSFGYALRNAVARWTKAYLNCVDLFCCLTDFQKQKLIAAGYDKERLCVIPNYIEYVEPPKESVNESTTDFIGYVGRLSEEKGFDLLLEVARRHPKIEFRFAGSPRGDREIHIPQNVRLCGHLNEKQLARFYADARFIVIPSRCYEGLPVALIESASHSRCCIAPNHGAFPDLILNKERNKYGGLLFQPGNVDDLETKVLELWNDMSKSEELGNTAEANYKERFQKKEIIALWDSVLCQVVKNETHCN